MGLSYHYNELKKTIKKQTNEIDYLIEREKTKTAHRIAKLKEDLGKKIDEL
jgi:NDP-sugar pyrophosphorylase family protein